MLAQQVTHQPRGASKIAGIAGDNSVHCCPDDHLEDVIRKDIVETRGATKRFKETFDDLNALLKQRCDNQGRDR